MFYMDNFERNEGGTVNGVFIAAGGTKAAFTTVRYISEQGIRKIVCLRNNIFHRQWGVVLSYKEYGGEEKTYERNWHTGN